MTKLAPPVHVLTRGVSASFAQCLRESSEAPDLTRARQQHRGYVDCLRNLGLTVHVLPALDQAPDAVFVEDTAVLVDSRALLTHPGAQARRCEVATIAAALGQRMTIQQMQAPACLDGGDVLRIGHRLLVGMSRRTNGEGVDTLAKFAIRSGLMTQTIPVDAGLHLKSAVTAVAEQTVIVDPAALDPRLFQRMGLDVIEAREPAGANVLALGDVLVTSTAAPKTNALLASKGYRVIAIAVDEFHTADGALTCLSLRTAAPGTWCC